jgi:adenine-specific DNA methylase
MAIVYGSTDEILTADPFAGGGAFPLEAMRLGSAVYASDLNPVAVSIENATLDYAQRYGDSLAESVREQADCIASSLMDDIGRFYLADGGNRPTAYIWFRTIRCEGPRCSAQIPLTSKFHLLRRGERSIGLRIGHWEDAVPRFEVHHGPLSSFPEATIRRGNATCVRCGFVVPVARVRSQLMNVSGGANESQLVAVVVEANGSTEFRAPVASDIESAQEAALELQRRTHMDRGVLSFVPDEPLPPVGTLGFRVQRYGMLHWRDLFTSRQLLFLSLTASKICSVEPAQDPALAVAVRACLALALDRVADHLNAGCSWNPSGGSLPHFFTRQAVPMIWDFGEANPFAGTSGGWLGAVQHVTSGLRIAAMVRGRASVQRVSACHHPLPTDSVHLLATDPPYYDAIPYADLSEFFYVWLRRAIGRDHPHLFAPSAVPRDDECIVNPVAGRDAAYFRARTTEALSEARRVTRPDGVGLIVFAHKSTRGWEDLLGALIEAGWVVTASWPINTENASRLRARNSAALGSSVHLVCRPRENPDGTLRVDVGSWRSVLAELPLRIHNWMPRLAGAGVVGADAIFACLGPALEIFSRHSSVERASGEVVTLSEYLEQVWAAVAREALSLIFEEADARDLEEDARVTAMWLWTVGVGSDGANGAAEEPEEPHEGEDQAKKGKASEGYVLEFDAARKIAQGLGAHLDKLTNVVEVKGEQARLLTVAERAKFLFRKDAASGDEARAKTKRSRKQLGLFGEIEAALKEGLHGERGVPKVVETTLDRVHQTMLLFAGGRSDALKRFVVDEGVGKDARYWKLAQSLSALYPSGSDEKRWVDGVLARKKSLGF